jgi:hypothetical protein
MGKIGHKWKRKVREVCVMGDDKHYFTLTYTPPFPPPYAPPGAFTVLGMVLSAMRARTQPPCVRYGYL